MSTTTVTLERAATAARTRPTHAPIPMSRIVGVELRKMFDTRSGFWLMMSVGIIAAMRQRIYRSMVRRPFHTRTHPA